MKRNYITKRITIDVDFLDNFIPSETFSDKWDNNCPSCPFFQWDDDWGSGDCPIVGAGGKCQLKKYF